MPCHLHSALRTVGIALASATSCALFAACGGTKSPSAGAAASTAATSPSSSASRGSESSGAITKSQALVFAHEVNLRASDVPQMTARSSEREKTSVAPAAFEISRCAGTSNPGLRVADVRSPRFVTGTGPARETVRSDVEVKPSAALAARDAAAIASGRGLVCIKRLLQRVTEPPTLSTVRVSRQVAVRALPAPLPAGSASFDIGIVLMISASHPAALPTVRAYFDALGFVSGPAEVTLTATHNMQPPSAETERRLLTLLYSRAKARKL
jgi:hypothetical protein